MNQQEFIRQLQDALARLPQQEKQEIIADYQEYESHHTHPKDQPTAGASSSAPNIELF